jgi:hypothetical protein
MNNYMQKDAKIFVAGEVLEFNGGIVFDSSKPDGTPRKS